MFSLLLTSIAIAVAVPGIYLLVLTLAALLRRPIEPAASAAAPARFAVVIPAHNEALSIRGTIRCVQQSDYDPERYRVFVIADNCSDRTAIIARGQDAEVAERHDPENAGKGQALDWFLDAYRDELASYDAVAIIDADTEMDSAFLKESSRALEDTGIDALQGHYGVSNSDQSWRAGLCEVAFASIHHLRPLGRNAIGSTAGLKGNGMVFRQSLLAETGWPAHSIVEDLEFTSILAQQGVRVRYVPEAIVLGEMAVDSGAATSQRRRWEGGRFSLAKSQVPGLVLRSIRRRETLPLDIALDLLTPPITLYLFVAITIGAITLALGVAPIFALAGAAGAALHLLAALAHRRVSAHAWRSLAFAPAFVLWKLTLHARFAFRGPETRWVRTRRAGEVTPVSPSPAIGSLPLAASDKIANFPQVERFPDQTIIAYRGAGASPVREKLREVRVTLRIGLWKASITTAEALKRGLDIAGSSAALVVLSPVFIATALLVKLEDGGPVFFAQERVGKKGRRFRMLKFRSMVSDAEKLRSNLEQQNQHGSGVTFKIKSDPRVTRIGRWIRKFSIDELPQFYNVLRGDMALVGPRPPIPAEVAEYSSHQLRRLRVQPGITCLWQIGGRAEIDFEGQVRLDLDYIHSESIWMDLSILVRTVPAVIFGKGAY